jgi:hypothetical protein
MKKGHYFGFVVLGLWLAAAPACVFDTSGIHIAFGIDGSYKPPHACLDSDYFFQFVACNGTTPYKWDLVMGAVPSGLQFFSDGVLKGKPTASGTYTFMVRVKDSSNPEKSYSEEFTVQVDTFAISDPDFTLFYCPGVPFDHAIQTCGGQAPLAWSLAGGSLPSGFKVTSSGHIQGTSSDAWYFVGTIRAVDSSGKTAQKKYMLYGKGKISILNSSYLPAGQTGIAYTPVQLEACGGSGKYVWDKYSGDLPSQISLSSSGLLSGTPEKTGSFAAYLRAKDQNPPNESSKKCFFIRVEPGPLSISTTPPLPPASECVAYSYPLQAKGGSGTYTWNLASGSQLPAGLKLDPNSGTIFGSPSRPKSSPYPFTVEVNDGSTTDSKALTLLVIEDTTVNADLVIPEVRHGSGAYNTLHTGLTGAEVQVDFRFKTAGVLQQIASQARLQCVGDCSTVSATSIGVPLKVNNDPYDERVAQFNGPLVLALVKAAGKKEGDTAMLRFWIDMVIDGKPVTYVARIAVKIMP